MIIRRFVPLLLGSTIVAGSLSVAGRAIALEPMAPEVLAANGESPKKTQPMVAPAVSPVVTPDRPIVIPAVSRLLPASTAAVLLMNPDATLWQSLTQFKSFPRDMTTPGWLFSGAFTGLSYHGDVAPWLGGPVGVAMVTGQDKTSYSATIVPVQDATQMPKFLDRVKRSRGRLPVMRTYNGINILYWEPHKFPAFPEFEPEEPVATPEVPVAEVPQVKTLMEKGLVPDVVPLVKVRDKLREKSAQNTDVKLEAKPEVKPDVKPDAKPLPPAPKPKSARKVREYGGYAIAYLPSGYVVASEKLQAVEILIDGQTGAEKLADLPAFQRMLQDDRYPKALISGYADYAQLMQSMAADPSISKQTMPFPPDSPQFQAGVNFIKTFQDRVDGFVWVQPEGLQVQASLHLKQPLPPSVAGLFNSPNALSARMPAVTYGMSDGHNLATFWKILVMGLEISPTTKNGLEGFRTYSQKTFGLDDRDIFPWMDQEYALYAFPSRGGFIPKVFDPKLELGMGAIVQTTQRSAATTALKKIETALVKVSNGQMKIQSRAVNAQTLTSWEMPGLKDKNPISVFGYQWVSPDTLTVFSGADSSLNLLPKPMSSLDQSANYQAAIAPLPKENMGYSYFNPPAMFALANRFGFANWFNAPGKTTDPEMDVSTIVNSVFSVAGTTALQGTQLSSDSFAKLATRPMPKLTAAEFLERAQIKLGGDNDWAIANFNRSIELDPQQVDAYYGRGNAKQSGRDFRGAISDFDRTLELDPKKTDALHFRAQAKRAIYDYTGTIADVTRALELKPEADSLSSLHQERATALMAQGNYGAALQDLDLADQKEDEGSKVLDLKCAASARSASADALKVCDKALSTYVPKGGPYIPTPGEPTIEPALFVPASLSAHRCLARVQKKEAKAFTDCGDAINADPENPLVYELQGQARLESGDRKGAAFSLEKALKLYQLLGDQTAIDRTQAFLKQTR
jgi:tetratricopeptide (TPR) repeat protein